MKKIFDIIDSCLLFDGISEDELEKMLTCLGARVETFDKKYTIFAEGGPAKYIGILLSGSAQLSTVDYYGNRSLINEVSPGEIFGEAFACAGVDSMPVTVTANEPSEVMLIDSDHILHTCSNNCAFHRRLIFNLMRSLATKNILFHRRLEVTSKRTTREKLLCYLAQCERKAGSPSFRIPFDRQELADYLEVDRSGLSAEISKLREEGVLECRKNDFRLLDR